MKNTIDVSKTWRVDRSSSMKPIISDTQGDESDATRKELRVQPPKYHLSRMFLSRDQVLGGWC